MPDAHRWAEDSILLLQGTPMDMEQPKKKKRAPKKPLSGPQLRDDLLSPEQLKFVLAYVSGRGNVSECLRESGLSESNATNYMKMPVIARAIRDATRARIERTSIDSDWVLKESAELYIADLADIMDDRGAYLPVKEWPPIWRKMLQSIEIEESYNNDGVSVGRVIKAKFTDRLKVLEMIGKNTRVKAFQEDPKAQNPVIVPPIHVHFVGPGHASVSEAVTIEGKAD